MLCLVEICQVVFEKSKMQKLTERQKLDKKWSEYLTWAIGSGDLKKVENAVPEYISKRILELKLYTTGERIDSSWLYST